MFQSDVSEFRSILFDFAQVRFSVFYLAILFRPFGTRVVVRQFGGIAFFVGYFV